MKKFGSLCLILVMGLITLAGCSKKESPGNGAGSTEPFTLKVTYKGGSTPKDLLDKGLDIFTQQSGIPAEVVFIPGSWADYITKLQTMIAGGDIVDTCTVAIEGFELMVKSGMAVPVDDWIAQHKAEWDAVVNDINPMVMDFMKFDGKLYGPPNEWNNIVTHLNTDLLKEAGLPLPPPDWGKEQFLEYAQKLTHKRPDGTTQYGCFVPNYYFGFEAWLYNNNAAYMTADFKKSMLLDPAVVEMFQFMYDLIYKYQVAPIPEPGLNSTRMLEEGNVAMIWAGRWVTSNYVRDGFKNVAVQYVPNFKTNVTIWGGQGVFTLKATKHPEEATSLAIFLASRPWVETIMEYGAIPVLNSVAAQVVPALGIPQNAELFFNSAPVIKPVQAPATYAECANLVSGVMSDILINRADLMTTLKAAEVELNSILMD
ncbi:MAG: extracellular solute-binding protein [Treponema sp.]|jgi:ABC-type glycerol-3-phosphate transport system substrate-binding protein|nr:extracellular solute-binding protein [Treponema sp.]